MEPGGTVDIPAADQHGLPVDTQQEEVLMAVLVEFFPRTVRLRLETSGVGPYRHGVEGNLPACYRQELLHVHTGTVYKGQAVLGHLLVQHDLDSAEGELPGTELYPKRTGTDEGGLPENHPYHDVGLVRTAVRPVRGVGVLAGSTHRLPDMFQIRNILSPFGVAVVMYVCVFVLTLLAPCPIWMPLV